jgi:secondary thiamine-phosphate synthase enzyme
MITQSEIILPAFPRGFHIVTDQFTPLVSGIESGFLHLFLKHTSAGLSINECADPDVLTDFESFFNRIVPENQPFLRHTIEGPDDMPAHVKAALVGCSVLIPIVRGDLALGTWQGIYLCEFRNRSGSRKVLASIYS